jgi:hypothetical protein
MWNKINGWAIILFILSSCNLFSQTFTYSGYIRNADGTGAVNVPVKLYRRTTPTLTGFTSQTNYNGHSYYRSTGSMTWTSAKTACENMGGHLATVSNTAENNFLFNTWPSGWIGYYQDRVAGYTYSEPLGGFRWTETQVTNNQKSDYDVSSYSSGNILTDIKGGINATLYNTPGYSSTGGKYLTFNGVNQYGITGNLSSSMGNTNQITLFAWIYPTGNGVILNELGTGSPSSGWHESVMEITGGNTLRVGFWTGIGIQQLSTTITLNTWYLVAITYDGTTMKGYLNNVNFGSTNFQREAAHLYSGNGEYFGIGLTESTNMGHGGYGSFRLGDFQVFNRALTADELDRTFNLYSYRYRTNQYTNWNPGEPNNSPSEDYTQFVGGGMWNDLANSSLPYVIEFDYINDFTPWALFQTVYTNSTGYYSFNQPTTPAVEWYIVIDAPTPITSHQLTDLRGVTDNVLGNTVRKSIHWLQYDTNNDGKISVSDAIFINLKQNGLATFPYTSRIFTPTQYTSLTTGTTDLRSTILGVSSITITSPVSGTTTGNYYLIAPGYKGQVTY